MRLTSLTVTGYRSFASKVEVHLRTGITCLIGANESGKSNLLAALNMLNGGDFGDFDRNAKQAVWNWPKLSYKLSLSLVERRELGEALGEYLDNFPDPLPEDRKKECGIVRGSLKAVVAGKVASLMFTVTHKNARRLSIGPYTYPVMVEGVSSPIDEWFMSALPVAHMFSPSVELSDSCTLAELEQNTNPPFKGLLKLAGLWNDRARLYENTRKSRQLLEAGQKRLTRKLRKIWTQGAKHTLRLEENAGNLHLSIIDPNTFDTPSTRSLGFRSFFSFYLSLLAETDEIAPEGMLLLFDEPGIHLHPQGQKDLLRELRRLSKKNQIIYTTHSPFMMDRNDPGSTLLVRKGLTKRDLGTRIVHKPYGKNWQSMQAALGITPSDAFFPPERVLVVEGSSDKVFLSVHMYHARSSTLADLNNFVVLDADRRQDVAGLVRILIAGDRIVVVLADADQGGDDLQRHLKKVAGKGPGKLNFLDLRSILDLAKQVSIEDALPTEGYNAAVQLYVSDVLASKHVVDWSAVETLAKEVTLGRSVGAYLEDVGVLDKASQFSKPTVADLYARALEDDSSPDDWPEMLEICKAVTSALSIATR